MSRDRRRESGGDGKRRYEEDRSLSGDRNSYQENPEVTERAAENNHERSPVNNFEPSKENADVGRNERSPRDDGSPQIRHDENGEMIEHKSPREYRQEERSDRDSISRSLGRQNSGYDNADPEDRRVGRRRDSRPSS